MTIAKMVREMIAKGVDPEVIELAVATAEDALVTRSSADVCVTERDVTSERRREKDRERQQRRRDNLRINRDSPQTSADVTDVPLSKESKKEESKEEREAASPRVTRTKTRTRLPELWQLDEQDVTYATERGFEGDRLRQMASAFANHHRANGTTMADWHAAWRKWTDNEIKFHGGRNGNGSSNLRTNSPAGQPPTRDAAIIAGMGRALERRRAARAADDAGRHDVREAGCAGAAAGADAESGAAASDDGSSGKLAFLPARYTGG